jgi:hypothetical protein
LDLRENPLLQLIVDTFYVNSGVEAMSAGNLASLEQLPTDFLARGLQKLYQLSKLPEANRVLSRKNYDVAVCMPEEGSDKK